MWTGPSFSKACFCPKQSPEAPETTDALPRPVQGPQQDPDPAQARVVLHQERTLTADRLERLEEAASGPSVWGVGWGCGDSGCRASLGQSSAESHDGQAEEGAEIGRGLGW